MCFCKCVYVEFLDPKTRGLAQAKIQLSKMEMLPYAVCKTGLGVYVVHSLCMLKVIGKIARSSYLCLYLPNTWPRHR